MVSLTEIRTHNATLKSLSSGLVAIFVGGTSGIGLSTAREFVRNTNSPHVYLVGRNQAEATRIIGELREINPTSQLDFIKSDVSLLKNVDEACRQIKEKEQKVNLLFMTVGYVTFQGRDETEEGLDRKFAVHYYARIRFLQNLSPLLTAGANSPDPTLTLSRAVSVLDPKIGRAGRPNFSDLSLKDNFTLRNCATHASAMNNFALEHFAQTYPGTSFVHAYPSIVGTGAMRGLGTAWTAAWKVGGMLLKPFMVDLGESGERHLFAATAPRYAPRARAERVEDVAKGGDDVKGSGSYQLNWDGETLPDSKTAATLRAEDAEKRIWTHTEEVFKKVCEESGKY
ncbi:NAD(P)-binding protein [Melanomma pulvis-pyrius CBS 109.77]|uniref:NAD(P)-binding protein n=1 Tax=Melanomma pulvis-pyrius CBS 109.77 TaxID=1314802 RepID=A0A6A6WUI0_9PLEO|nr:NAD(P)-binding protein [Melanomma pulvis-pyrius CBS 109.77]